jgi:hypothetical protein
MEPCPKALHESVYIVLGLGMALVALKAQGLSLLGLPGYVVLVALASYARNPQGHLSRRVWSWHVCIRQDPDCNIDDGI